MKYLITVLFVASASFSYAADTTPSSLGPAWQGEAQKEIKEKNYDGAIKTLLAANEPNSADWNNLLGYAQRKKSPPNLNAAEFYYQAALKIDPKHKGALEYYGELLLMKNNLPGAEQMLARLDKVCFFSCEEYRDLKEEIAKYKAKK
jgi:tetratricopeptide (TPR) repeat protein